MSRRRRQSEKSGASSIPSKAAGPTSPKLSNETKSPASTPSRKTDFKLKSNMAFKIDEPQDDRGSPSYIAQQRAEKRREAQEINRRRFLAPSLPNLESVYANFNNHFNASDAKAVDRKDAKPVVTMTPLQSSDLPKKTEENDNHERRKDDKVKAVSGQASTEKSSSKKKNKSSKIQHNDNNLAGEQTASADTASNDDSGKAEANSTRRTTEPTQSTESSKKHKFMKSVALPAATPAPKPDVKTSSKTKENVTEPEVARRSKSKHEHSRRNVSSPQASEGRKATVTPAIQKGSSSSSSASEATDSDTKSNQTLPVADKLLKSSSKVDKKRKAKDEISQTKKPSKLVDFSSDESEPKNNVVSTAVGSITSKKKKSRKSLEETKEPKPRVEKSLGDIDSPVVTNPLNSEDPKNITPEVQAAFDVTPKWKSKKSHKSKETQEVSPSSQDTRKNITIPENKGPGRFIEKEQSNVSLGTALTSNPKSKSKGARKSEELGKLESSPLAAHEGGDEKTNEKPVKKHTKQKHVTRKSPETEANQQSPVEDDESVNSTRECQDDSSSNESGDDSDTEQQKAEKESEIEQTEQHKTANRDEACDEAKDSDTDKDESSSEEEEVAGFVRQSSPDAASSTSSKSASEKGASLAASNTGNNTDDDGDSEAASDIDVENHPTQAIKTEASLESGNDKNAESGSASESDVNMDDNAPSETEDSGARKRKRSDSQDVQSSVASRNPRPNFADFPSIQAAIAAGGIPKKKRKVTDVEKKPSSAARYPQTLLEAAKSVAELLPDLDGKGIGSLNNSDRLTTLLKECRSNLLHLARERVLYNGGPSVNMQTQLAAIAKKREEELNEREFQLNVLQRELDDLANGRKV